MDGFYPSRTGNTVPPRLWCRGWKSRRECRAGVPGFLRQRRAAVDRDGDGHVAIAAMILGGFHMAVSIILRVGRIDCRLADRQWQPIAGDRAHLRRRTGIRCRFHLFSGQRPPGSGRRGYVGVVACILDDGGEGSVAVDSFAGEGECRGLALRQRNLYRIGEFPVKSAVYAAFAAAVAQAPVVQPRRSSPRAYVPFLTYMWYPRLMERLTFEMPQLEPGWVWLTGAGPGDPGRRAACAEWYPPGRRDRA